VVLCDKFIDNIGMLY